MHSPIARPGSRRDRTIGRFIQPDSIDFPPGSPQASQRFVYAKNSPIVYNDPDGHCFTGAVVDTILCAAAVGALIGGGVNAVMQYNESGQINWHEVAGSAAAGAVSATILVAAGPASLAGAFAVGAVANVAGNQVGAAVEAGLDTLSGEHAGNDYWDNYADAGGVYDGETLTNVDKVAADAVVGGTINALTLGTQRLLSKRFNIADPFARPPANYNPTEFRLRSNGWATTQAPLSSAKYLLARDTGKVFAMRLIVERGRDTIAEYLQQKFGKIAEAY